MRFYSNGETRGGVVTLRGREPAAKWVKLNLFRHFLVYQSNDNGKQFNGLSVHLISMAGTLLTLSTTRHWIHFIAVTVRTHRRRLELQSYRKSFIFNGSRLLSAARSGKSVGVAFWACWATRASSRKLKFGQLYGNEAWRGSVANDQQPIGIQTSFALADSRETYDVNFRSYRR